MFDKLFKSLVLVLLFGFLFLAFRHTDSERYSFHPGDSLLVFDKRTGALYVYRGSEQRWHLIGGQPAPSTHN